MDFMPNGYAKQNNPNSAPYASLVADHCRKVVTTPGERPGTCTWLSGLPWTGPVAVWLEFTFRAPRKAMFDMPATTKTGDLDKLTRNVFDALKTARVYADDSLVVEAHVSARYCTDEEKEGTYIIVDAYEGGDMRKSVLREVRTWWLDMVGTA
jgi:hypothetical protein